MMPATGERTGWGAWSQAQADLARQRYRSRNARLVREQQENEARLAAKAAAKLAALAQETTQSEEERAAQARKKAIIEAALARAREKQAASGVVPKNTGDVSPAVQAQIDAAEARRKRLAQSTPPTDDDVKP
jgi:electron transport complex protein RnfB